MRGGSSLTPPWRRPGRATRSCPPAAGPRRMSSTTSSRPGAWWATSRATPGLWGRRRCCGGGDRGMRAWLVRNWFLLLLALGLAAAILWPDWLRPAADRLPLRWVVGLSLFLAALGLEGGRLARALSRPRGVLWALGVSYGCLPLLALLLGLALPL